MIGIWIGSLAFAVTLDLPTQLVAQQHLRVRVSDAPPGSEVAVMFAAREQPGVCSPLGDCLDIGRQPQLVLRGFAEASGDVDRWVTLAVAPGDWFVQAIASPGRTSDVLAVTVLEGEADLDQDGATNLDESWAGTPLDNPDADADGILDGDDVYPFEPSLPSRWVPDDVLASDASVSVPDPEFDTVGNQVAWQTVHGEKLWVADVDPLTGFFVPRDGRGTLVDEDISSTRLSKNGPEWVQSTLGGSVLYNKDLGSGPEMMVAYQLPRGWTSVSLGPGRGPMGSLEPGDPHPRITYRDPVTSYRYTRFLDDPSSSLTSTVGRLMVARWIGGGTNLIAYVRDSDRAKQVVSFDPTTGAVEFRTHTPTEKRNVYGWFSPEYGVEAFFTTTGPLDTDAQTAIEVYLADGSGGWALHDTITPPPSLPFVVSAEPLEFNGHSYITFLASDAPTNEEEGGGRCGSSTSIPRPSLPTR